MSVKRAKDWVTICDESREVKRRKSERKEEKMCQYPWQEGHRERVKLTELVERLKRTRSRRKLNKLVKRWIWLPNRSWREISLQDLYKIFKKSELGRHILAGGSHSVPAVEFVKEQHKMLSIITEERLFKELKMKFEEHIGNGLTEKAATEEIRKSPTWNQFIHYRGTNAELIVKKAIVQIVEELEIPSLTIRSLFKQDVLRFSSKLFRAAGMSFKDREKQGEYDLLTVLVSGDSLAFIFVEVKNRCHYPWRPEVSPPRRSMFEKKSGSWSQLSKSITFVTDLFPDISFASLKAFTAIPNMSKTMLEKYLGAACLQNVLCKEHFENPAELRRMLGADKVVPATDIGKNLLCEVTSRLVGPASECHISRREPAQVLPAEAKQLREEM